MLQSGCGAAKQATLYVTIPPAFSHLEATDCGTPGGAGKFPRRFPRSHSGIKLNMLTRAINADVITCLRPKL